MTTRVVVIGNGMAGSRLVEELLRRDPDLEVTVFGAEHRPAYNRILLSDVLAGKRPAGDVTLTSVARARRFLEDPAVRSLEKPFQAATLVEAVERVLLGRAASRV